MSVKSSQQNFRLNDELLQQLKTICDNEKLKPAEVLRLLIAERPKLLKTLKSAKKVGEKLVTVNSLLVAQNNILVGMLFKLMSLLPKNHNDPEIKKTLEEARKELERITKQSKDKVLEVQHFGS